MRHRYDDRVAPHHRPPIAELARHLDTARDTGERLEPVARDLARMKARAASDDVHALHTVEDVRGLGAEGRIEHALAAAAALARLGARTRLLEDFFEHVMTVLAAFDRVGGELADLERTLDHLAGGVEDGEAVAHDLGDVAVFQEDEALRDGYARGDVGGDAVLAAADTDHARAAAPRRDHHTGFRVAHHAERIRTMQFVHRGLHGMQEAAALFEMIVDLVHHHYRVGLGGEFVSGLALKRAQAFVVLDDAVVHHRHGLAADVRMGIGLGGLAVRGPPRVRDAAH